jgi:hypothetical protein
MGLRAEQTRAMRPLEEARCTRLSWEFIGSSSPAASLEGARLTLPGPAERVLLYGRRVCPKLSSRRCFMQTQRRSGSSSRTILG